MDSSTSAPLEMCFICGGPETPTQKLVLATSKGYHGLLGYVETVGNAEILKRLNEAYEVKSVRYHRQCKCDLYNESVKVTTEAITDKYILSFSFFANSDSNLSHFSCSKGRERVSTEPETTQFICISCIQFQQHTFCCSACIQECMHSLQLTC